MVKVSLRWRRIHPCGKALFGISGMGSIKKGLFSAIAICTCLVFSISAIANEQRGIVISSERQALVIGNNAYQTAPLKNPVNDAEDMSRVLSELGFQVILHKNVDRRVMEDAIRGFGRQLRNGGVGLFYFAGHGIQLEGQNYLIPINARIESESDVKYEAVDAGLVLGKMEDAKNQLNIIILDACRNNPYARRFRSENMGLARMDAPTGSLIVYATAPGEVAADGPERNGVFTRHLLKHMQTPNLPVEQVLKRVRIDVAAETKQRQIPWEASSLMGDFFFVAEKITLSIEPKISKTPMSNSSEISSLPKASEGIIDKNNSKIKLGIFPIFFSGSSYLGGLTKSNFEEQVIKSIKKSIIENGIFNPTFSYYTLTLQKTSG